MPSLYQMFESNQKRIGQDFWYPGDEVDEGGDDLIKRGLELRSDRTDGSTFWDDFMAVFGQNLDDAEKFLGVPKDKIARWPAKVRKGLASVRAETGEKKKKNTMMPTGVK